jgi:hypothetical protein
VISPAAGICLEACSVLHYAAVQRADENRERRDMRKTAQTTLRMSETRETAASTDGRALSARTPRRRVGDPMGPVLSFRRAARSPRATRKAR